MYKIRGSDQKEYGPASADQVREWIRQQRANGRTPIQVEGIAGWKPLAEVAEFADALAAAGPVLLGAPPPIGRCDVPRMSSLAVASLVLGILGLCSMGLTAVAGLVLGMVALGRIKRSSGMLGGRALAVAGVVVSAVLALQLPIGIGFLLPVRAKARGKAQVEQCSRHLRQLGLAMIIYADGNREALPAADTWSDSIKPDVHAVEVFRCPAGPKGEPLGYAYNAKLGGKKQSEVASGTVMLFESDAGWNAAGGPELLIEKPRHGLVNICFSDGHVEAVALSRVAQLRWEP